MRHAMFSPPLRRVPKSAGLRESIRVHCVRASASVLRYDVFQSQRRNNMVVVTLRVMCPRNAERKERPFPPLAWAHGVRYDTLLGVVAGRPRSPPVATRKRLVPGDGCNR
jgi:hypothetical protein